MLKKFLFGLSGIHINRILLIQNTRTECYTCIGTLEIPDMDLMPENNIKIHTRQGVDVHFDTRACVAV